jgi:hypothetical protein
LKFSYLFSRQGGRFSCSRRTATRNFLSFGPIS